MLIGALLVASLLLADLPLPREVVERAAILDALTKVVADFGDRQDKLARTVGEAADRQDECMADVGVRQDELTTDTGDRQDRPARTVGEAADRQDKCMADVGGPQIGRTTDTGDRQDKLALTVGEAADRQDECMADVGANQGERTTDTEDRQDRPALTVGGAADRLDECMADVRGPQIERTTDTGDRQDKLALTVGGAADRLDESMAGLGDRMDMLARRVSEAADRLDERMDRQDERMAALQHLLGEVAESLVVPSMRQRLRDCIASTVAFLLVHRHDASFGHCSAVPVPAGARLHIAGHPQPPAGSSTHFLTAAHCFFDESRGWQQFATANELVAAGEGAVVHQCTLHSRLAYLATPAPPLDLALVACSTPVQMPPTAASARPRLAHDAVALAGFSKGARFDDAAPVNVSAGASGQTRRYAMHLHYTRLRGIVSVPDSGAGLQGAVSAAPAGTLYVLYSPPMERESASLGFVDYDDEEVLSGGAVLDFSCGVVGITGRRGFGRAGRFVKLSEHVLALLRGALCWGSGAEAC